MMLMQTDSPSTTLRLGWDPEVFIFPNHYGHHISLVTCSSICCYISAVVKIKQDRPAAENAHSTDVKWGLKIKTKARSDGLEDLS